MPSHSAADWKRQATQLAWFANVAWVVHRLLPLWAFLNLFFCIGWVLVRDHLASTTPFWWGYACGLFGVWLVAYFQAKGQFLDQQDGLVRLEQHLGLKNRLSAAMAGKVDWPVYRSVENFPYTLVPTHAYTGLVVSFVLLFVATMLPSIQGEAPVHYDAMEQPVAWEELEAMIAEVEPEAIIEERALQQLEEKLQQLRDQSPELWYTQSSLEAGEALKQQTLHDLAELAGHMQTAASILEARQQMDLTVADTEALDAAMEAALDGMAMGTLPLASEPLSELQASLASENLPLLDEAQMEALAQAMQSASDSLCEACALGAGELTAEGFAESLAAGSMKPGQFGINRGPGDAPLTLKATPTELQAAKKEGVSNEDFRNAALGETLETRTRPDSPDEAADAFELDTSDSAVQGRGGDVIWRSNLTPDERALLEDFYQ